MSKSDGAIYTAGRKDKLPYRQLSDPPVTYAA